MDACDYEPSPPSCSCSYTWTWIIGIVAVLALILTLIIWIIYFVERGKFISNPSVSWTITPISSNSDIPGDNYNVYVVGNNVNTVTISPGDSTEVKGNWFAITNTSSQSVQITPGTGVQFDQVTFPTTGGTSGTPASISRLESGETWILVWIDSGNTLVNISPGGVLKPSSS